MGLKEIYKEEQEELFVLSLFSLFVPYYPNLIVVYVSKRIVLSPFPHPNQ